MEMELKLLKEREKEIEKSGGFSKKLFKFNFQIKKKLDQFTFVLLKIKSFHKIDYNLLNYFLIAIKTLLHKI